MNDPFVKEQADHFAERVMKQTDSIEERIKTICILALGREPTPFENDQAKSFLKTQAAELAVAADQLQNDKRLWSDLCHAIFNTKDFIFIR
jgi:hypothetical protein